MVEQSIPEELLPIERLEGPVHEGRPERGDRKAGLRMHAEQHAFGRRLVLRVWVRDVIRHQRVTFPVIEPWTVSGNARHEHETMKPVAAASRNGLHLFGGRAVLPVVRQVEDRLETPAGQQIRDPGQIGAVGLQVANLRPEIMLVPTVQHRYVVAARDQAPHDLTAHKLRSSDDDDSHARMIADRASSGPGQW